MAFPVVVGRSADGHASGQVLSFKVTIPVGANGELLVITWGKRGGPNTEYIIPAGWTAYGDFRTSDNTISWQGIWRIADGTEDTTVTLETTAIRVQSACIQRISGHDSAIPPAFTLAEGLYDSSEPDPPNNDTGISKDYLWIAAMCGRGASAVTGGPVGYSNLIEVFTENGGDGSGVGTATAENATTAQAENPATFTTGKTNAQAWIALTIVIAPVAIVTATGEFSLDATTDLTFTGFVEPEEGDDSIGATGETGVWRSGVWVEPLDAEGDFALDSAADLEYTGRFAFGKPFNLEATSVLTFPGAVAAFGDFDINSASDLEFTGTFVGKPGVGTFALSASASVDFAWVPKFDFPGSEVGIPDDPAEVIVKVRPGDVIVIGGITGVVVIDDQGRLVVIDHAGEVLCILGPGGVEL